MFSIPSPKAWGKKKKDNSLNKELIQTQTQGDSTFHLAHVFIKFSFHIKTFKEIKHYIDMS